MATVNAAGAKGTTNRGICSTCGKVAPARHEFRESQVVLIKECPDCGPTETVVSTNVERYRRKRELTGYSGEAEKTCGLNCLSCTAHKPPTLVFLDVTNRCNMNCPICLANIPAMGFRFDPPRAYFERIFAHLSTINPRPKIQLFGGEPTCREDLIELIEMARDTYGLEARVVTNGIRLADEDYCKRLLATGCQLMFSFDGRSPEIYARTRKSAGAYDKKLAALENIRKHRKSKITIMVCVGEGINDTYLADLVQYCHEGRDFIAAIDLIPLTAHWGPEDIEAHSATIEDVERIMTREMPGTAFFPAAVMYRLETLRATFPIGRLTFGGAHPNCESVTAMISDGTAYAPLTKYLTRPLDDVIADVLALDQRMGAELPRSLLGRLFGRKGRQAVYARALYRLARSSVNLPAVFGGAGAGKVAKIVWGLLQGRKLKHLLRQHTRVHGFLRVIVLPFEEKECVEAARLVDCPAQFAYEHPVTKEVRLMPVCSWVIHKNPILRETAARYGVDARTGSDGLAALKKGADADAAAG